MSCATLAVWGVAGEGSRLLEKTVLVVNTVGLHARPASLIAQTASRFAADVSLKHGHYEANGKSIMGLLGLAASHGAEVVIRVAGADEEQALAALEALFASGFGEP